MKFEITCKNCILAELSNEDLDLLKLTYDQIDYSDEYVRDTLRNILDTASAETGVMLNRENEIRIDVMPDLTGGCLIIFSKDSDDASSRDGKVTVFVADDFNNLLDCARVICKSSCTVPDCSLYRDGESFRLIAKNCEEGTRLLLLEYMDVLEDNDLSEERTSEYWQCLIQKNALKILSGK